MLHVVPDKITFPLRKSLPTVQIHTHSPCKTASWADDALAGGYSKVSIAAATVWANPSQYFIVNYWSAADYTTVGHIPGAMQYSPKADLTLATYLKTLPTDKTIAVYPDTGQTSANVATILRVHGYDAKSISLGTQD